MLGVCVRVCCVVPRARAAEAEPNNDARLLREKGSSSLSSSSKPDPPPPHHHHRHQNARATTTNKPRMLADDLAKRVVIVDTSNEIGGDGDVPHAAIGGARRMMVRACAARCAAPRRKRIRKIALQTRTHNANANTHPGARPGAAAPRDDRGGRKPHAAGVCVCCVCRRNSRAPSHHAPRALLWVVVLPPQPRRRASVAHTHTRPPTTTSHHHRPNRS